MPSLSQSTGTIHVRTERADVDSRGFPPLQAVDIGVLERMFDLVPDAAFFVKDRDGRYVAVNTSLVERHGLRRKAEALGRKPSDICPGEFGRLPTRQDAEVLSLDRPLVEHLEMHWQAPHEPCWCLTTKLPLHDAAGKVVGLIGISRDLRAPIKSQEMPLAVAQALGRFEERLGEPISTAELAAWSGLPPARFARLIKRFFGLTPGRYVTRVRIAAASNLLRETDQTVAEIAAVCGFADHSSFTRAFRKVAGVSPTEFRETVRR